MNSNWWGYDFLRETWVYMDRTISNNAPEYKNLPCIFVDCKKNEIFEIPTEKWVAPRFLFEGKLRPEHKGIELAELERYKRQMNLYKYLLRSFLSPVNNKTLSGNATLSTIGSPKKIRDVYGQSFSEEAWKEILDFVRLMVEIGTSNIETCNQYITDRKLWSNFPSIRSLNTYSYSSRGIPGITLESYRIVKRLLGRYDSVSASELLHSQRY